MNKDWLGAQNNFSLLQRAMAAYPIHFNEKGIRLNGVFEFSSTAAINYVASIGNGTRNYNISGLGSFDANEDKTITGRIGFFPGLGDDLEVGVSYMTGELRDVENPTLLSTNIEHYAATTSAFGFDATYEISNLIIRGYYISSDEELRADASGADPGTIERNGYTGEVLYTIRLDRDFFMGIRPKFRYDHIELNQISGAIIPDVTDFYKTDTMTGGVDFLIDENFRFSLDYNITSESGHPDLDNDRFVAKVIAQF